MIASLVRTVMAGLVLAGVIHVVAILTIPTVAPDDALDRISRAVPISRMTLVPADGSVLPDLDPFFLHAACRFDLSSGAVAVSGSIPAEIWTVAVVAETIGLAGSFERGIAPEGDLEIVVGRPRQVEQIRLDRAENGRPLTAVELPGDRGFLLVRAFAGRDAEADQLGEALRQLNCGPVQ